MNKNMFKAKWKFCESAMELLRNALLELEKAATELGIQHPRANITSSEGIVLSVDLETWDNAICESFSAEEFFDNLEKFKSGELVERSKIVGSLTLTEQNTKELEDLLRDTDYKIIYYTEGEYPQCYKILLRRKDCVDIKVPYFSTIILYDSGRLEIKQP